MKGDRLPGLLFIYVIVNNSFTILLSQTKVMNERDIPSIWEAPAFLPYIQPPLTPEAIADAEAKIGYPLPKEYIDLLYMQNGGYIRYSIEDTGHRVIHGIGPYYPCLTDFDWLKEYDGAVSYDVNDLIPFDGDGHWAICLDYRKDKSEPAITYIDTESDYEKTIAADFKEYLRQLVISTEWELVSDTGLSMQELAKQASDILSTAFNRRWEESGSEFYNAAYQEGYVTINSNKVPAGFLRPEETCYEGYLSLKNEWTTKYPNVPGEALLINVSTHNIEKVFRELTSKGIVLKKIGEYYQ